MNDAENLLTLAQLFLQKQDYVWTFILLVVRFSAFISVVPGIGSGLLGASVRLPAILLFSAISMASSPIVALPPSVGDLALGILSEVTLGFLIGFVPLLIVSGFQLGGHLSSTSMGLGGAQLFDPTSGTTLSEIAKLYGDLVVLIFLFLGGHLVAIEAVSGFSSSIMPGTFLVSEETLGIIVDHAAGIFEIGMLVASPVVVALLITQFMMGLTTKMVPTVNIFVVSFPLTVGIGLLITAVAFPTLAHYANSKLTGIEATIDEVVESSARR